ncbi:MAG: hypothetical protein APF81_03445 [Desulfosporosinus sp. BRH_c37]|nr:MAG: hypothetical protein APF81_03445 [Desulfosporosinus sp. BRH_c37]
MRKRAAVLVLSLLILCVAPMQAFALGTNQVTNSEIGPLWVSITEFTNSFEISGSGLAQFDTSLYARSNINKVVINASIQQYINGSWQAVNSWTSTTYSNSGYLNQKWYVMSGYYYRLVSSGAVYQDDVLVEQTSYTGPSYWY